MAAPTTMTDLSVTAASNSPAGSDAVGPLLDDFLRSIQAIVRRLAANSTVASATTTDIGAVEAEYLSVSGTTTITGLGTVAAGIRRTLVFEGALTLTHNGTSLILPGAANITTAAGDVGMFRSLGSGNWRCEAYTTASGAPLAYATNVAKKDSANAFTANNSFSALTTMSNANLTTAQVGALSVSGPAVFSGLTTMGIAALTTASVGALSVSALTSLSGLTTIQNAALTTASVGALSVSGLATLNGNLNATALTTMANASLTTAQIGALTVTSLMALNADATLAENVGIYFDAVLSADGKYSGIVEDGTAGAALAFGELCYFQTSDSRWEKSRAAAADLATASLRLGMCVLAAAGDGSATKMLVFGKIRADSLFPTFTIGAPVYMSAATAGVVTSTAPTGTTDFTVRKVGFAVTGDELFFSPSNDYITLA